jgi:hypothetical protein
MSYTEESIHQRFLVSIFLLRLLKQKVPPIFVGYISSLIDGVCSTRQMHPSGSRRTARSAAPGTSRIAPGQELTRGE